MRHRNKGRHLNRTRSNYRALLRSLAISIITHGIITTTVAKGKEVRGFLEKLVTKAKRGDLHNRRIVYSRLNNKEAVYKLFSDVVPRLQERCGGYLKILKYKNRSGDNAPLVYIGFVDCFCG